MLGRALAFVALLAVATSSGYIPGREYVYKHRGYMFTGFPDKKPQYSGIAFEGTVTIQPKGEYAVFKVDDSKYSLVNDEFEDFSSYPYEHKGLPPHAQFLLRPFRVYFKNGQITQFQVSADEPAFARNVKRGLISLFHLNLDDTEASGPSDKDNEIYTPDDNAHYYRLQEEGVLGDCETAYVIEHHPYPLTPHNNIVLNVTKVKNYHKCTNAPNHFYSNFYGHECGHSEHEKAHTLHGNANYYYSIRGDRHHYVIEHVISEGELAYTPYPLEGQSATLYINRSLELVDERAVTQDHEPTGELKSFYSLRYEIPFKPEFKGQVDLKKPHYFYHIYGRKAKPEGIRGLVTELVAVYDDDSYLKKAKDKNYPALFLELVRAFSTLSYSDIEALYKEYAEFEPQEATPVKVRQRNLFYDVLVNTGTNPALLFEKHLIKNRKVSSHVALYFIQQAQHHVKEVTEVLLDEIQDLCEDGFVKSDGNLYASCYSTLTNIVFDRCVARYSPESGFTSDVYTCPDDIPVKYFNHIIQLFGQTDDEFLKVMYLKAAGNLGVKEIIRYVRPCIEGRGGHSLYLRSTAIWALKNTGFRYRDQVRELLIPLYVNASENYELRLSAITLLLMYKPGLYELEIAARSLISEQDDQVRSYVYSTLKSFANSTHPCDHQLARDARYAIAALRRYNLDFKEFEEYDYSFSHHHYASGYDKNYDYGGHTRFAYFASDTGYIPRTVYLGINDYIGGKSLDTFGVGFKQYGLEKFVDKIFGPEGAYGKRSLFDLFKKRSKRDLSNVEKERREIHEKLKLKSQDYPPIQGEIFFKYMGNHLSFCYFNESTFENFFREGAFPIPNYPAAYRQLPKFHYQRFLLAMDLFYVIPSEAGLPVIFDYKQPVYFYHKNNKLELSVNPAFFRDERQNQLPTDVKLGFDGHIIADKNLYASLGVMFPFDFLTFGAGINRRSTLSLPTKLDFTLDLKNTKLTTKWTPVVPHEIYHFDYESHTFMDIYKNHIPVHAEKSYLPVRRKGYKKQVEKNFFHDALGLGINMKKDFDNEWNDLGSWFHFLTRKDYREKFYYLYANPQFEPYHYDITLQAAEKDATTEVEASLSYSSVDFPKPSPEPEFQPYGDTKFGREFLTCLFEGQIIARGQKERKVQAELLYSRNFLRLYHKLNLYYQRTPFTSSETENFKICASAYLKYPDYDYEKVYSLDSVGMDRTTEGKMKIHFGKDCHSDKKIVIHAQAGASDEQLQLERAREVPDTPEHYNPYAYYYQKCRRDQQSGQMYPKSCIDYIYLSFLARKHVYHVTHEKLTPEFLNATYKLGGFFRHAFYDYSDHNTFDVQNPDNELHIEANFSAIYPVADVRVRKPRTDSHYTHVYVPTYCPFMSYPFYQDVQIKKSLNKHYCLLDNDFITTFDRYVYKLPDISCYTVFAKDCSPNENYIVLTGKISHPKYARALKVIIGNHKVEILPVSDDSGLIVRVDGKKVAVSQSEPYYYYDESDKQQPVFYIYELLSYYTLQSPKYGLSVEFDGHFIYLVNSIYYRNKLCGLCGNYNGQKHDGYETEDGCYITDTDVYAYGFAIPSDTCTVPKADYPCYGEAGAGCTDLRTHVVQLATGKVPQTCFSIKPVPQCRSGCVAANHVTKTIGFHCLPSKDDSTKKLLRQQQQRILYEVRRKSQDHEAEVQFAEGCYRQ